MKLKDAIKYLSVPSRIFMVWITLLAVVLILGSIIYGLVISYARPIPSELSAQETQAMRRENAHREFLPDGSVVLVNDHNENATEIYDENQNLLWTGKRIDNPYNYLQFEDRNRPQGIADQQLKEFYGITPEFSRPLVIPVVSDERNIRERWRYDYSRRLFTGYDSAGQRIGCLGANGFVPTREEVQPLGEFRYLFAWSPSETYSPRLVWQTAHEIYQIDFSQHSLKRLFESRETPIEKIAYYKYWCQIHEEETKYRPTILVELKSGNRMLVLGNPEQILPIHIPETMEFDPIHVVASQTDIFLKTSSVIGRPRTRDLDLLIQWWQDHQHKPIQHVMALYRITSQGSLERIRQYEWTWTNQLPGRFQYMESVMKKTRCYLSTASPAIFDSAWRWYYKRVRLEFSSEDPLQKILAEIVDIYRPMNLTGNLLLALLMAILTFCHAWPRRTTWGALVFWLIFVMAFNLAGLLTYLALNHVPLIRCAACGKKRGLNRLDCPHCKAGLAIPKQKEIDSILINPHIS